MTSVVKYSGLFLHICLWLFDFFIVQETIEFSLRLDYFYNSDESNSKVDIISNEMHSIIFLFHFYINDLGQVQPVCILFSNASKNIKKIQNQ